MVVLLYLSNESFLSQYIFRFTLHTSALITHQLTKMSEPKAVRFIAEIGVVSEICESLVRIQSFLDPQHFTNTQQNKQELHDGANTSSASKENDVEVDLSKIKKKKKKKNKSPPANDDCETQQKEPANIKADRAPSTNEVDLNKGEGIWAHDATKPIPYHSLLSRFVAQFQAQYPSMSHFERDKVRLPPPLCQRDGSKKTIFANISDICECHKHLQAPNQ
jgi:hypothetical protein